MCPRLRFLFGSFFSGLWINTAKVYACRISLNEFSDFATQLIASTSTDFGSSSRRIAPIYPDAPLLALSRKDILDSRSIISNRRTLSGDCAGGSIDELSEVQPRRSLVKLS
ncbi:hypothetical protein EV421DRAFT_245532 [Armillaria borealis]|uniref:Secreted protein n=1 Tax=Armillaria borealis TaxID=47425 RepID=A0AA39IUI4_9AGAR|nr:hypothetical protein EV421DRAFT_245532 [Armillaria borealis]